MFKLLRVSHEEKDHYVLVDGTTEVVAEDRRGFMMLGATFDVTANSGKDSLHLIKIDDIDELILNDTSDRDWEVEVDQDFKIYLKSQTI